MNKEKFETLVNLINMIEKSLNRLDIFGFTSVLYCNNGEVKEIENDFKEECCDLMTELKDYIKNEIDDYNCRNVILATKTIQKLITCIDLYED